MKKTHEQYITIAEASENYGISTSHLALLARTEQIEARKSGSIWLVSPTSVENYKERMEELGPQKHALRYSENS